MYLFLFTFSFLVSNLVIICYSFLALFINLTFSKKEDGQDDKKILILNILN